MCEPLTICVLQFSSKLKKKKKSYLYSIQFRVLKDNERSLKCKIPNCWENHWLQNILLWNSNMLFKDHGLFYCTSLLSLRPLFSECSVFEDEFYCWIWQAWHKANLMSPKGEFAENAGWRSHRIDFPWSLGLSMFIPTGGRFAESWLFSSFHTIWFQSVLVFYS